MFRKAALTLHFQKAALTSTWQEEATTSLWLQMQRYCCLERKQCISYSDYPVEKITGVKNASQKM